MPAGDCGVNPGAVGLNWFDQKLPFIRKSGVRDELTPLDLTDGHAKDPIVSVDIGGIFAETGFRFLMRDLLQIALAPNSEQLWVAKLFAPPSPEALRESFAPIKQAFRLDDPKYPCFQVRGALSPDGSGQAVSEHVDDVLPVGLLLPEEPTNTAESEGQAFYTKPRAVVVIGSGAIVPVLYSHIVLFAPTSGGYYGLPHRQDSIKFELVGRSLWENLWLGVVAGSDRAVDATNQLASAEYKVFHGVVMTFTAWSPNVATKVRGSMSTYKTGTRVQFRCSVVTGWSVQSSTFDVISQE
jgi:CRISPR system Cascade subunit CasA